MSAWEYAVIRHALDTLAEAKAALPPLSRKQRAASHDLPYDPDEGPRMVDVPDDEPEVMDDW